MVSMVVRNMRSSITQSTTQQYYLPCDDYHFSPCATMSIFTSVTNFLSAVTKRCAAFPQYRLYKLPRYWRCLPGCNMPYKIVCSSVCQASSVYLRPWRRVGRWGKVVHGYIHPIPFCIPSGGCWGDGGLEGSRNLFINPSCLFIFFFL